MRDFQLLGWVHAGAGGLFTVSQSGVEHNQVVVIHDGDSVVAASNSKKNRDTDRSRVPFFHQNDSASVFTAHPGWIPPPEEIPPQEDQVKAVSHVSESSILANLQF
jgi:hypothetical protein